MYNIIYMYNVLYNGSYELVYYRQPRFHKDVDFINLF